MKNQKRLKQALLANAIFSSCSAIVMIFFSKSIAELMSISQSYIFLVVGIGLLLFAMLVYSNAKRNEINRKQVQSIIVQDWIWVIASIVILGFQLFNISYTGYIIIGLVALIVADFALMQGYYLKRI